MDASLTLFLQIRLSYALRHLWPGQYGASESLPQHYVLWMVEKGAIRITVERQSWLLEPGMIILMPMVRRSVAAPQGAQWLSIAFQTSLFGKTDPLQSLKSPALLRLDEPDVEPIGPLMHQLVEFWMKKCPVSIVTPAAMRAHWQEIKRTGADQTAVESLVCQGFMRAIFGLCWQRLETTHAVSGLRDELPSWLSQALALINEKPGNPITQLAHDIGFSPSQLRRAFHEWLGVSPQQYVFQLRMEHAQRLLETTNWPINEIARHLGFRSTPTFTRIFKQNFGMPPAQFRYALRPEGSAEQEVKSPENSMRMRVRREE